MNALFAKEIMETLKGEARTCLLIGGEPTLYPEIEEIISFGANLGLKMVIVSNGRKLKNKKFTKSLFAAGLDRAVISLEGASKEIHNSITNRESFNDTSKGIEVCAEFGKANTLTTICEKNSHEVFSTIRLSYELGSNKAVLNCAVPTLWEKQTSADYCLNPKNLARIINDLFDQGINKDVPFQLNATLPLCLIKKDTLEEALKRKWISVGCHMYRGKGAAFDPDGNILPCTHFSEAPLFTNTIMENGTFSLKEKFLEMWSDQAGIASKFRSGLWKYPAKKCAECKYWGGCIGGCPLLWTYFDPLIFIDEK
jgi:radical SAM protein with 4Fe4S-binding SPASM domain